MENYIFDTEIDQRNGYDRVFVLIIYDIIDNKKRLKLAKYLAGFGFRVQKSSFEARIPTKKYREMLKRLPEFVSQEDSIRVYKIIGQGQVTSFGYEYTIPEDIDLILI